MLQIYKQLIKEYSTTSRATHGAILCFFKFLMVRAMLEKNPGNFKCPVHTLITPF